MRQFHTLVLERLKDVTGDFTTEPYEVGWANEAILFVRVEQLSGDDVSLAATTEISADGIHWVDEGTRIEPITVPGDHLARISHFGGWLRFRCQVGGADPAVRVTIHLVLKE